jgi:hypothetical protein
MARKKAITSATTVIKITTTSQMIASPYWSLAPRAWATEGAASTKAAAMAAGMSRPCAGIAERVIFSLSRLSGVGQR